VHPRGVAARRRILAAALELFLSEGYEAATVRAIGRRAGVSDSALYYYFESKAAILEALLVEPQWPYPERPIRTVADLRQLALDQFSAWLQNASLVRLTMREALSGQPLARHFSVRMTQLAEQRICDAAAKVFPPDEAEAVSEALDAVRFGAIADALLHAVDQLERYASSEEYRAWLATLVDLVLPEAAPGPPSAPIVPFPRATELRLDADGSHRPDDEAGGGPRESIRRTPRERGNERTRERILQAAAELFAERGFDGTSMKAVAARVGLSDAALYYYFRSKHELLEALWDIPEIRRFGGREQPEFPSTLAELVDAVADTIAAQDTIIHLTAVRTLAGDRTARSLREYTLARWRQYLLRWLERRLALPPGRRERVADALTLAVLGTVYPAQIRYGTDAPSYFRSPEYRGRLLRTAERLVGGAVPAAGS